MGKQVRVSIAGVARAIVQLQEVSETDAFALNIADTAAFRVQPAPDTERAWLAVGYVHSVRRGSKRAAERAARALINQCAAHLQRYPNRSGDTIARVREA